jgi:solute carrier family 50 (sugar transporter)
MIVNDMISHMQIPNGLGVLFALGQLGLYAMFYKNTKQIMEARRRKADQQSTMMEVVTDASATPPPNNNNGGGGGGNGY